MSCSWQNKIYVVANYVLQLILLFFLLSFLLDTFGWTDTMERRPAKLRVILNPDDTRKLILPGGIPETVEELINQVRKVCGLNCKIRLQYQDRDFGDTLVNLTSTAELEDFATIKVIPPTDDGQTIPVCDDLVSTETDDTELLSLPSSSISTRTQMWPKEFPIPTFSYDMLLSSS